MSGLARYSRDNELYSTVKSSGAWHTIHRNQLDLTLSKLGEGKAGVPGKKYLGAE